MTSVHTCFSLGNTQIPAVGFGTYLISDEDAAETVAKAISVGYRHIDTAAGYQNERGVGAGIAQSGIPRDQIFVTTKLWPGNAAWGDPPKDYDQTRAAFEVSREALGLDFIDLYLIHAPSGADKRVEQWRALCDLKASGLVRAIGVSNYTEAHIEEIRSAGLPLPDANQIELHPWSQKPDLVAFLNAPEDLAASLLEMGISSMNVPHSWAFYLTGDGLIMFAIQAVVGALVAFLTFGLTAMSLPLLVDKEIDFVTAMLVSLDTVSKNKAVMAFWALIIAVVLFIAMVPLFLGLFVALPVLGHATWHLYRRALYHPVD